MSYNKKTKGEEPTMEMSPQWVTVKEEFVASFFDLADSFAKWQEVPSNSQYKTSWLINLRSLYLKLRLKMLSNKGYGQLTLDMDKMIFKMDQRVRLIDKIKYTRDVLKFIEELGLTKVENEKIEPSQNYYQKGFG